MFAGAAVLLSVERICYLWAWHAPESFRRMCERLGLNGPDRAVDGLRVLFYAFKLLQVGVFVAWWAVHGRGVLWPPPGPPWAIAFGAALLAAGQLLNVTVFHRLGTTGVFYGNRFGFEVQWCRAFPYSWLEHPQYVGAILSIWGCFSIMRYPQPDWYVLPSLETLYYALGARFER